MTEKEPIEKSKKRVLIIENDATVRDTLVQMVLTMGHETMAVERVTRGVQVITKGGVDAVLLDLHMPGPHGQDLLRFLKKKGVTVPPTIVVSGYLRHEAIQELLGLGVCGVVAKPFDPSRLRQELDRALQDNTDAGRFCSQCGAASNSNDQFCRQCGTSLQKTMTCEGCNSAYTEGDRFCGECGAGLPTQRKS